jgi:thiol-disulfide isomerase/thioredoxin
VRLSLEVTEKFPNTERGAQSLYWLGANATADPDKIRYWEQDRAQFPPTKFNWSADAMESLFDVYARTAPEKALSVANEMESGAPKNEVATWQSNVALAQNLIAVRKFLAANQFTEAKALLEASKISRYSNDLEMFDLLKAEATAGAGDPKGAYDALCARYAKEPADAVHVAILKYGSDLGKTPSDINSEVWALRDASAKAAPSFDLDQYLASGKKSLLDYKGKVVLLTFWFPGCGPCRGEFPHFENVLKKFRGQDVSYVGINVLPGQDEYVKPFMRGTHYSFTPLRGDSKFAETVYHVRGEPTNFLIDKDGRIVYSNFRAHDPQSERMLQLMIQSLLDRRGA